jgi:hypothetical protein
MADTPYNVSVPSPFQRERGRGGWGERERQKLRDKERERRRERWVMECLDVMETEGERMEREEERDGL